MANNPTPHGPAPTSGPQGQGSEPDSDDALRRGAARHHAKVATQAQQVKGGGATTGGFATSPGAPKIPNSKGKFVAKGVPQGR